MAKEMKDRQEGLPEWSAKAMKEEMRLIPWPSADGLVALSAPQQQPSAMKILLLDMNGVLIYRPPSAGHNPKIGCLRPFAREFFVALTTAQQHMIVGFWSSMRAENLAHFAQQILPTSSTFAPCLSQADCCIVLNGKGNGKPLFRKSLSIAAQKLSINASAILCIDDSPEKFTEEDRAQCLFVPSFVGKQSSIEDNLLEPSGPLCSWLLRAAVSPLTIAQFIAANPFTSQQQQ